MRSIKSILFLLAFIFVPQSKLAAEAHLVKIGVIIALTGEASSFGEATKNGIEIALSKMSEADRSRLQIIYEDDGFQPKNTVAAFQKLVSVDKVSVVITMGSGTSNAVAPLAERHQIPLIAVASDPNIVKDKKYSVLFWVTPEAETDLVFPEAIKRGYRSIARVTTTHDGAYAMRSEFDRKNKELNNPIKLILDEEFPSDIKDFKSTITKIRALDNLDAIMVLLMPGQAGIFAKQAREAGVMQPFFSYELLEDPNEIKAAVGAFEGAWFATAGAASSEFSSEFSSKYPDSMAVLAPNAHDSILMIAKATVSNSSSEAINKYLHEVKDFTGALGTFSATDDSKFTLPAVLKVVKNNKFENF